MKKILSLLMVGVTLLGTLAIPVNAATTKNENSKVDPRAIIYCDNSPSYKHECYSKGVGQLVSVDSSGNKRMVFTSGSALQCKYCNLVVVTEYNPLNSVRLGYWAARYYPYSIGSVTRMEVPASDINMYWSTNKIEGINFRPAY